MNRALASPIHTLRFAESQPRSESGGSVRAASHLTTLDTMGHSVGVVLQTPEVISEVAMQS